MLDQHIVSYLIMSLLYTNINMSFECELLTNDFELNPLALNFNLYIPNKVHSPTLSIDDYSHYSSCDELYMFLPLAM